MCIVVLKPKNKEIPEKETLKTCFDNNPDGAGYMFAKNNKVIIKKGFMTFKHFYKSVIRDYKKHGLKNNNLVMHFRIGTQAKNDAMTTHPYPISSDIRDLQATRITTDLGVVHNGILYNYSDYNNKILNDTQTFIKDFLSPIKKLNKDFLKYDYIRDLINKQIDENKLVFLDNKDNYTMFGAFVEDDGVFYSNTTYKHFSYNYDTYYTGNTANTYLYNDTYKNTYDYDTDFLKENLNDETIKIDIDLLRYIDDNVLIDSEYKLDRDNNYYAIDKNDILYEVVSYDIDDRNRIKCKVIDYNVELYNKETLDPLYFDELALL